MSKVKKKIQTPFGDIVDNKESKEQIFGEQCRTDEQKEKNALRSLHARLSEQDREKAYKWSAIYRCLIDEDDSS